MPKNTKKEKQFTQPLASCSCVDETQFYIFKRYIQQSNTRNWAESWCGKRLLLLLVLNNLHIEDDTTWLWLVKRDCLTWMHTQHTILNAVSFVRNSAISSKRYTDRFLLSFFQSFFLLLFFPVFSQSEKKLIEN